MGKEKKQQAKILGLIIGLVAVLIGGLLFMGAVSGWFDDEKIVLDKEYYSEDNVDFLELGADKYEDLVKNKKSFIVFVDQNGCTTADRLREYITQYAKDNNIAVYRMMFSESKDSSLNEYVKYYPSVAFVDKGLPCWYLRADSDEDADIYNNYDSFRNWMNQHL